MTESQGRLGFGGSNLLFFVLLGALALYTFTTLSRWAGKINAYTNSVSTELQRLDAAQKQLQQQIIRLEHKEGYASGGTLYNL